MKQRTLGLWLMRVADGASGSLQAHHSLAGVYDMKKETNVEGRYNYQVFKSHGSLSLAVKNPDGTTTSGDDARLRHGPGAEGDRKTGPNALHAGDNIKVMFLRRRTAVRGVS